jgi:hypothetical protein
MPEIEGEYSEDRAKALIEKLREENKSLKEASKEGQEPQSDKDARAIAALKKQVAELTPKANEYEKLAAASKTELERATESAAEFQRRAEAAVRAEMVKDVALTKGLPASLARRIQGDDQAALEADADELLSQFQTTQQEAMSPRAPRPDASQGSSANGRAARTPAEEFAALIQQK